MAQTLADKRVAIVATDYFEERELVDPKDTLEKEGARVDVLAPEPGEIKGLNHVDPGQSVKVDMEIKDANPMDYDAVVVPGGVVNADNLRMDEDARHFVQIMMEENKPTAVICHGPWLLVSAGLVDSRELTSYHTLQDDIENAGGAWVDNDVVVDGNLITSRKPDDLPVFTGTLINTLTENVIT